jgi:hypothetical protein
VLSDLQGNRKHVVSATARSLSKHRSHSTATLLLQVCSAS